MNKKFLIACLLLLTLTAHTQTPQKPQDESVARLFSTMFDTNQVMIETKDMVTKKSTKQEASFEIVP